MIAWLLGLAERRIKGRVKLRPSDCRLLQSIYERPPGYVGFRAGPEFGQKMREFLTAKKSRRFATICWMLLDEAANDRIELNVNRRVAFGLLALLDIDMREIAQRLERKWLREWKNG